MAVVARRRDQVGEVLTVVFVEDVPPSRAAAMVKVGLRRDRRGIAATKKTSREP